MENQNDTAVIKHSPSWEQMCADELGTIYRDWYEDGVRCLIVRGPGSLCAYVGVPLYHPLAYQNCMDFPLNCHGRLTFGCEGDGVYRPKGWFWYGFDYSHFGDYVFYNDQPPLAGKYDHLQDKKWTVDEVEGELRCVALDFKKLMNLVESVAKTYYRKAGGKCLQI
jgi:hypothetical protein